MTCFIGWLHVRAKGAKIHSTPVATPATKNAAIVIEHVAADHGKQLMKETCHGQEPIYRSQSPP